MSIGSIGTISYEEFSQIVEKKLLDFLPCIYREWTVEKRKIYKVNQILDCINIVPPDNGHRKSIFSMANFYLQDYFKHIEQGIDVDNVIQTIASDFTRIQIKEPLKLQSFNIEDYKNKIVVQVINYEKNKEYLRMLPHIKILDLAVICRIVEFDDKEGIFGAVITNKMREEMNYTDDVLFQKAIAQTNLILTPKLMRVCDGLFALTNCKHYLGAGTIVSCDRLSNLSDQLETDLYVLPSSIHEVMVVPVEYGKAEDMRNLVKEANATVVNIDEWLSDEVYMFSGEKKELSIV